MSQGDQESPDDANGGDNPSAQNHKIVAAINAIGEKYETAQRDRAEHDNQTLKWAKRAGIGVGIYTLLTLALAVLAYCAFRTAQEQVGISRDTEIRQLRAYVGVLDHKIQDVALNSAPRVQISIKNFGSTPATNVTYWVFSKFDSYPTPVDLPTQVFKSDRFILFPADGFTPTFDIGALNQTDITQLGESRWLYAYGEIDYLDAFEKNRCTKFRLMYGGPLLKIGRMAIAGSGNEIDRDCQN
jgi:hypothetical protein